MRIIEWHAVFLQKFSEFSFFWFPKLRPEISILALRSGAAIFCPFSILNPLRGCNSDLAHYSNTPSLLARIRGRGRVTQKRGAFEG